MDRKIIDKRIKIMYKPVYNSTSKNSKTSDKYAKYYIEIISTGTKPTTGLSTGDELLFETPICDNDDNDNIVPYEHYYIENVDLLTESNNKYGLQNRSKSTRSKLRGNERTEIKRVSELKEERSGRERVDQVAGIFVDNIDNNLRGDWYQLQILDKNIKRDFCLPPETDYNIYTNSVRSINNIYKIKTAGEPILIANRKTSIASIELDLDIFIIGDTHIGIANEYNAYERYDRNLVEQIIDTAIKEEVDAVVHTGDIFANCSDSSDVHWMESQLERLKSERIDFIYIRGNHDTNESNKPNINELANLANFTHVSNKNMGSQVDLIGYDHDEVEKKHEVKKKHDLDQNKNQQELVFTHLTGADCPQIKHMNNEKVNMCSSAMFAGHCHSSGTEFLNGNIPLIYTGSVTDLEDTTDYYFRTQLYNGELIIIKCPLYPE